MLVQNRRCSFNFEGAIGRVLSGQRVFIERVLAGQRVLIERVLAGQRVLI